METLNAIYEWMLSNGIRASLLVPLVLAIQWLLRKKLTAQWRYSLWLPVLVVLILPGVPVLPTVESQPTSIAPKSELPLEGVVSLQAPQLESAVQATQRLAQDPAAHLPATPLAPVKTFDWQAFLAKAWMLTAAGALLLVFGSFFVTIRRFRRSRVPVGPELTQRVSELASAAGLRRAPQILMSEAVPSPAVAGFWKPVLLLNAGFGEGLSDEESDLVLSHELAHIRRGDLPLNALLCALLALHWFNPFLWLAFLRARADREAACDAHVLRGESAARCSTYGHTLLKMETGLAPRGLALGFVGLLPTGHSLRSRIRSIISQPKTNNTMKIVTALSITVLAFAGLAKAEKPLLPKDVAPAEFKAHFDRVDSPESMRSTEFLGIENGKATIAVSKMNPLTKKFSKQLVTVMLADLDPALRAEIEAYWAKKQKMEKAPAAAPELRSEVSSQDSLGRALLSAALKKSTAKEAYRFEKEVAWDGPMFVLSINGTSTTGIFRQPHIAYYKEDQRKLIREEYWVDGYHCSRVTDMIGHGKNDNWEIVSLEAAEAPGTVLTIPFDLQDKKSYTLIAGKRSYMIEPIEDGKQAIATKLIGKDLFDHAAERRLEIDWQKSTCEWIVTIDPATELIQEIKQQIVIGHKNDGPMPMFSRHDTTWSFTYDDKLKVEIPENLSQLLNAK
jgi:beta-lactamase regulating signal transducer with metallopeptidase domain